MSCTFWNLRRRKAALAAKMAIVKAEAAEAKPTVEVQKKTVKKGGVENDQ